MISMSRLQGVHVMTAGEIMALSLSIVGLCEHRRGDSLLIPGHRAHPRHAP